MADEAFALSPISARAALPSEEDYEAISQAFMETSRGRWFLGEYAKRNRNADTRMVLDAVARIEETLAAQKQPPPDNRLPEALVAIRQAVDEANTIAAAAVENLAADENLAPIRKGARIIREISWRWREIGGDGRICDLLDSQVSAIENACGQVASSSPQDALGAAFDLIKETIAELDEGEPAAAQAVRQASPANDFEATVSMPAEAVVETTETTMVEADAVVSPAETLDASAEVAEMAAEALDATPEAAGESREAAEPYDEALLDIVALEMAAPDPADVDDAELAAADEAYAMEAPPAESVLVVGEEPTDGYAGTAAGEQAIASTFTEGFTSTIARSCGRTVPWLQPDRQRHRAKAAALGLRPAGADPPHEPGREDRAVLVNRIIFDFGGLHPSRRGQGAAPQDEV